MHHTMIVAAPARTVARRWPAVAVKSDVKTGHDIAYVFRGHASGCAGAMAYYTRSGELPGTWEAKERQAQRAYAAGPKDVSAELKDTALAEADQRQAAAEAEAQGDEATARALHSLAHLLGTHKESLEADHAQHEDWSAGTAGLREEGAKARAELARRGQASELRPGETTLEWWHRFERDCQTFEQHLANLQAQAEAEDGPWPPEPTAEREAAPEVEPSNEADLNTAWNAELVEQPSHDPESDMPEATAEI
jgi:hypothetical protein